MSASPQNAEFFVHKKSGIIHTFDGCHRCNKGASYFPTHTLQEAYAIFQKEKSMKARMCTSCEKLSQHESVKPTKSFDLHVEIR